MRSNKLVIFVGSGVSANSNIPTWGELIKKFAEEIGYDKCNTCKKKLASCKKNKCPLRFDFNADEYLKIPQYFYNQNELRTKNYYEIIKKTLSTSSQSNAIDDIIFRMFPHHIITTNYDKLLENSREPNTRFYNVIVRDNDMLSQSGTHYIIKMHGDIDEEDTIVLKENDYLEYSQSHVLIETYIKSLLIDHTFLFVGYSLNDYNLRLILSWINYFYKDNCSVAGRPKNFLIQATNTRVKPYEEEYFRKNNIIIFNTEELPENIFSKFQDLEMNDFGKKLYSCLDYILDESNDFLVESLEDVIYDRYQILSEYNRISQDDLLSIYSFKHSAIKAGILVVYNRLEYSKLLEIIASTSLKSNFIREILFKTGINYIHQLGEVPVEILVNSIDLFEDRLFDLYLENNYIELLEIIKESHDNFAQAYYYHICNPQFSESIEIMKKISNENITEMKLINLIIFKYNNILLKGHSPNDLKVERNELSSIFKSLPQDLNFASKYIQNLYDGLPENLAKMKILFYEHEAMYTRESYTYYFEDNFGKIHEIQTIAYDYYYYIKQNYIMFDFYSNPKSFLEPYLMAMLCTLSPYKNFRKESSFGTDGRLQEYSLNMIDLDMIVKFSKPSSLKAWLLQYKVKRILIQDDVDLVKKFENLCKTICFSSNQYFIDYLHSFSILLTKVELNSDQISRVAKSVISLAKFCSETNINYLTRLTDSFMLVSELFKDSSNTLLTPLLDILIQGEVYKEYRTNKRDEFTWLIEALSSYSNVKIRMSVLDFLDNSPNDELVQDIMSFRKLINKDDIHKYLNGNLELLSYNQSYRFMLDKIIPYTDSILSLYIQKINDEIIERVRNPGVRSYPDHLKSLIDQCVILYLVCHDVNIARLRPYMEHSKYLQFLIEPENFDYSKVDTSDYMWVNFFRHTEFNETFINHKKEILNEKLVMMFSSDIYNLEQAKIVFGVLLDQSEIWEFGNS